MEIITIYDLAKLVEVDERTLRIEKEPGFYDTLPDAHGNDERHWSICNVAAAASERIIGIYRLREQYFLKRGIIGGDAVSDVISAIISNAEEHGNKYDDAKIPFFHSGL